MKTSWWKMLLAAVAPALAVLVVMEMARAAFVSRPQVNAAAPPPELHMDAAQAAEQLAGAISITTVSERESDQFARFYSALMRNSGADGPDGYIKSSPGSDR